MLRLFFVPLLLSGIQSLEEYSYLGSCDGNTVPYKLEVNSRGRPELVCTRPYCFGEEDRTLLDIKCSGYREDDCSETNEWIGGLMEVANGSRSLLKSKCCSTSPALQRLEVVKSVTLGRNEEFTGGLFISRKGIEGFDVIKEVRRTRLGERTGYEVLVVRMPCKVDVSEEYELLKRLGYLEDQQASPSPLRQSWPSRQAMYSSKDNLLSDYYNDYYEPEPYPAPAQQPMRTDERSYPVPGSLQVPFTTPSPVPPEQPLSAWTTLIPVKIVPRTIVDATTTATAKTTEDTTPSTTTSPETTPVKTSTITEEATSSVASTTTLKFMVPKRLHFTVPKKDPKRKERKTSETPSPHSNELRL